MTSAHIRVLAVLTVLMVLAWLVGSRVQRGDALNRLSGRALFVLSLIAFAAVASGLFFPWEPQADEGAAAHIFQLAVVAIALAGTLFLSTARWNQGLRSVKPLAAPAVVLAAAFGTLYCFEHFR